MMMRRWTMAVMGAIGLVLPACGDDEGVNQDGETSTSATTDDGTSVGEVGSTTGEPGEFDVWQLRVPDFEPPVRETHYACFSARIQLDQLAHIVGFRPQVTSPLIHHYVLGLAPASDPTHDPNGECYDWIGDILWAWAPGIEDFMLPDDVGYLVGDDTGGEMHLVLQVHYNNPLLEADFVDNEGIDILYTNELRPNTAGILTLGEISALNIPPGDPGYEHVATCTSAQTQGLLAEPINVFASFLHAHDIGKTLWGEHFRGAELVGELGRADPYYFDGQFFEPVDRVIEPGDELVTHCVYDSSDRTAPTVGGVATSDEMCVNFLMYYPKQTGNILCGGFS